MKKLLLVIVTVSLFAILSCQKSAISPNQYEGINQYENPKDKPVN